MATGRDGSTHRERGSAVVEFALLLPILLLLVLALVQVGVLARDRLLLAQASRAGAREAAITDSVSAVVESATLAAPGLDPARLRITVERAGARGAPVTVSAAYDVPIAGVLAGWLLPESVTLDATATTRQEFG
ncbi:MAG: TadE/TadG family type IV pilus assembly protein [Actinomycetota bacterium]